MTMLLAGSFVNFIQSFFANWKMLLFVLLTVFLLLTILTRGVKPAFITFLILAIIVGIALLIVLIINAITWDLFGFIDFAIAWLPTINFSFIVVFSTWWNSRRGLRKSLIFLLHATLAGVTWILFFIFGVKSVKLEEGFFGFANWLSRGALQDVAGGQTTFRGILVWLLTNMFGGSNSLIGESSAYLYTLADLAYHVVFAIMCYIFYLLTVFLLWLIYHMFYSERKYKKQRNLRYSKNQTDSPYKKHRLGGAVVGLVRGVAFALIGISFLGSFLYMFVGKGEGKFKNIEIENESLEVPYTLYRSIESYGTNGIFMVLNLLSDANDMPYYLFAADLVLSGELNDEEHGINEKIKLREEVGAISSFAHDSLALMLQYGGDELSSTGVSFTTVLNVMQNERFRTEFDALIDTFNTPTYLFNFSLSLVNSVMAHIDDISLGAAMSPKNKELMKIVFKKGYLSSYIPEDRELILSLGGKDEATGKDIRPYLGAQQLVTKDDAGCIISLLLNFLSEQSKSASLFDMARSLIPYVRNLSLMQGTRKDELDPVFTRVYCYVENAYLSTEEGGYNCSYNRLVREKISWTDEMNVLLDVLETFSEMYGDIYSEERDFLNMIFYVFDEENQNRTRDIELYDILYDKLTASRAVSKVFATSFVHSMMVDIFQATFEGFYLKEDVIYSNSQDGAGNITYGELHYLLRGVRALGSKENKEIRDLILGNAETDLAQLLKKLSAPLNGKDEFDVTLSTYLTQSELLRSALSAFLITKGGDSLYVPDISKERAKDGSYVNVINKREFQQVLENIEILSDFVTRCIDSDYKQHIDNYLYDPDFYLLVEGRDQNAFGGQVNGNRVIEGTIASLLSEKLRDNTQIIIPRALMGRENAEEWVSPDRSRPREMRKFWDGLLAAEIRVSELLDDSSSKTDVLNHFVARDPEKNRIMFRSQVFQYTATHYIDDTTWSTQKKVVVPKEARKRLTNDRLDSLIVENELVLLFSNLDFISKNEPQDIITSLITYKADIVNSYVLSATAIANMIENNAFNTLFGISVAGGGRFVEVDPRFTSYREQLTEYDIRSPWYLELPSFINGLDVMFQTGIALEPSALLTLVDEVKNDAERLDTCKKSTILRERFFTTV